MEEMQSTMSDVQNRNDGYGGSLTPGRKRKRGRTRWGPDDGEEGGSEPVGQTDWVSPTPLPPLEVELEGIRPQAAVAVQGTPKRRPKRRRWGPDEEGDHGEGESPPVPPLLPESNLNGDLGGAAYSSAETMGRAGEGGMDRLPASNGEHTFKFLPGPPQHETPPPRPVPEPLPPPPLPPQPAMQVPIPAKKYPGINFFELLIGPRGITQKLIEQETGTKLSIRGPGMGGGDRPPASLPAGDLGDGLHVHITGETEEAVTQARERVAGILLRAIKAPSGEPKQARQQPQMVADMNGWAARRREAENAPIDEAEEAKARSDYQLPPEVAQEVAALYSEDAAAAAAATAAAGPPLHSHSMGEEEYAYDMGPVAYPFPGRDEGPRGRAPWQQTRGPPRDRGFDDPSNLYVGGLPPAMGEGALRALFEPVGLVVDAKVITDRVSGASRGFGFVRMADEMSADAAIQSLNGYAIGGKRLTVRRKTNSGPGGPAAGAYPEARASHMQQDRQQQPFPYPPEAYPSGTYTYGHGHEAYPGYAHDAYAAYGYSAESYEAYAGGPPVPMPPGPEPVQATPAAAAAAASPTGEAEVAAAGAAAEDDRPPGVEDEELPPGVGPEDGAPSPNLGTEGGLMGLSGEPPAGTPGNVPPPVMSAGAYGREQDAASAGVSQAAMGPSLGEALPIPLPAGLHTPLPPPPAIIPATPTGEPITPEPGVPGMEDAEPAPPGFTPPGSPAHGTDGGVGPPAAPPVDAADVPLADIPPPPPAPPEGAVASSGAEAYAGYPGADAGTYGYPGADLYGQAHGMYPTFSEAAAYGDPAAYAAYAAAYPESVGYPEPSANFRYPDTYAPTQYPSVVEQPYRRSARAPAHQPPPVEPPPEKPKLEPPTVNVKVPKSLKERQLARKVAKQEERERKKRAEQEAAAAASAAAAAEAARARARERAREVSPLAGVGAQSPVRRRPPRPRRRSGASSSSPSPTRPPTRSPPSPPSRARTASKDRRRSRSAISPSSPPRARRPAARDGRSPARAVPPARGPPWESDREPPLRRGPPEGYGGRGRAPWGGPSGGRFGPGPYRGGRRGGGGGGRRTPPGVRESPAYGRGSPADAGERPGGLFGRGRTPDSAPRRERGDASTRFPPARRDASPERGAAARTAPSGWDVVEEGVQRPVPEESPAKGARRPRRKCTRWGQEEEPGEEPKQAGEESREEQKQAIKEPSPEPSEEGEIAGDVAEVSGPPNPIPPSPAGPPRAPRETPPQRNYHDLPPPRDAAPPYRDGPPSRAPYGDGPPRYRDGGPSYAARRGGGAGYADAPGYGEYDGYAEKPARGGFRRGPGRGRGWDPRQDGYAREDDAYYGRGDDGYGGTYDGYEGDDGYGEYDGYGEGYGDAVGGYGVYGAAIAGAVPLVMAPAMGRGYAGGARGRGRGRGRLPGRGRMPRGRGW